MKSIRTLVMIGLFLPLTFLWSQSPALSKTKSQLSDPYMAGLHFLRKNDYVSAVGYLEKAVRSSKYKNCAIVHYYLANALWKRGRKDDALIAYGKSYVLDPTGQTAKHSVRVLQHYSSRVKTIAKRKPLTAKSKKVLKVAGVSKQSIEAKTKASNQSKSKPLVDAKLLAYVKKKAPGLPKIQKAKPDLAEFYTWNWGKQAEYIAPAESRLENAKANLNRGLNEFRRAKRYANRLIPVHRNHSESAQDFEIRKKAGQDQYEKLINPYRQEIASRADYVNQLIGIRNRAWLQWGQSRCIPKIAIPEEAKTKKG